MIKKFDTYINEGVRDMMTPKSEEEIMRLMDEMSSYDKVIVGATSGNLISVQKGLEEMDFYTFDEETHILKKALEIACENGNLNIVQYLLNKCSDKIGDIGVWDGFLAACDYSRNDVARYILDVYPNIPIKSNSWPLRCAIIRDNLELVKLLIDRGSDMHIDEPFAHHNGKTPLQVARDNGYDEVVDYVEQYVTKTNESIRDMMTPRSSEEIDMKLKDLPYTDLMNYLMDGVIDGDEERVERVFKHIKRDFKYCKEMAETAINYGNKRIIKMFLDKGMPQDVLSHLYDYAYERQAYDVSDLIKKYIRANESIRDMMTPKSKEDIILSLKKSGKLKPEDKLEYGAKNGKLLFVRDAIEKDGLDTDWNDGFAMRLACIHGHANIVKYLLEMGADRNRTYKHKKDDWTPIKYAEHFKHYDIVHLLDTYFPNVDLHRMNNKIKSFFRFNESVRDKMIGKSEDDIMKSIQKYLDRFSELGTFNYKKYGLTFTDGDLNTSTFKMVDKEDNEWFMRLEHYNGDKGRITIYAPPNKLLKVHANERFYSYSELEDYLDKIYGLNESVRDKMTPKSEEEILKLVPEFTEVYSDIKHWTKYHKDNIVVGDIEYEDDVCYFTIYIDNSSVDYVDRNVLIIYWENNALAMSLKRKGTYESGLLKYDVDFSDIVREMNKLRTLNESVRNKMTPITRDTKQELMSHIAEKVAKELVNLNKSGLGISGITKYDEALDFVISKMDMVEMLVDEYGCTDPYKIAINIQYDKKLYGYRNKTDEGLKNIKTMISHKNNYNKMIKKFTGYINEGVKKTPDTEKEFLEQNPNFVELYSDVKHWTKDHEDVIISAIESYFYGSVCYAYFKIIVDGVTPVQEFDDTYDKNVLMVMCNYDKHISLLLKKKFVYEWETISHYTEFPEIIKEMNKLRTPLDKSQKS